MKTDGNGSLSGLFFSHKSVEKLCKTFKSVFVMDCTYKTNRFGIPLLNIAGITSTFRSFNAGFAFICEETELEYTWALKAFSNVVVPAVIVTDREKSLMNAIESVFPDASNLLCIWHVNKNVLANCMKYRWDENNFENFINDWNDLILSNSLEMFEYSWKAFVNDWSPSNIPAVQYLERTCLVYKKDCALLD